jgi:hypothetical protein
MAFGDEISANTFFRSCSIQCQDIANVTDISPSNVRDQSGTAFCPQAIVTDQCGNGARDTVSIPYDRDHYRYIIGLDAMIETMKWYIIPMNVMIETMRWYIIQIDSMVGTQRVHHQFPKSL